MINDNENEAENQDHMDTTETDLGLDIRHRCTKYKMCLSIMMMVSIKQHVSNI